MRPDYSFLPRFRIRQLRSLIELCEKFLFCRLHVSFVREKYAAAEEKIGNDMCSFFGSGFIEILACFSLQVFLEGVVNRSLERLVHQLGEELWKSGVVFPNS